MGTTILRKGFFVVDDFRVINVIPRVESSEEDNLHEVDCFAIDKELDALEEAYFKS